MPRIIPKLKSLIFIGLCLGSLYTVSPALAKSAEGLMVRDKARIIFSGHSLTDAAVPIVRSIAEDQGKDLISVYQSIPGSPIRVRTRGMKPSDSNPWEGYSKGIRGEALNLIDELREPSKLNPGERYDLLVITERHNILNSMQWESTISLLNHFHELLVTNNPDASSYFYQSWLKIDKSEPQAWIEYERDALTTWECIANKINQSSKSEKNRIAMIPTGWALSHFVQAALNEEIPGLKGSPQKILDKIFSDDVHMTPLGGQFIGAFTYSVIFGQSPEGARLAKGVPKKSGKAAVTMAWELAQRYHQGPNPRTHTMNYCRAHVVTEMCTPYWKHFLKRPERIQRCQKLYQRDDEKNPFHSTGEIKAWPAPK